MINFTSLDISKRLAEAGFLKVGEEYGPCDAIWFPDGEQGEHKPYLDDSECMTHGLTRKHAAPNGVFVDWDEYAAYRSDTLMEWLLSHGDSIEITPDLDGFNVTYWVKHDDYNGINIFLPDALGEVILAVLAKEAEHGKG